MVHGVSALGGMITSGAEDHNVEPFILSESFVDFYSCCARVRCVLSSLGLFACAFELRVFVGMQALVARLERSLKKAVSSGPRVRKYSSRHHLRKDMVRDHPVLSVFVSGASNAVSTQFHCMICRRDVSMLFRGSREWSSFCIKQTLGAGCCLSCSERYAYVQPSNGAPCCDV